MGMDQHVSDEVRELLAAKRTHLESELGILSAPSTY